jgi:pimeloyl-ACP methyl ester carboxylesterase
LAAFQKRLGNFYQKMKGENERKKCIFKVFSLLLLIFTIFTLFQFNIRKVENPDLLKRGLWWFDKKVSWRKCGELECASISVPLDHRDLHSPKIKISIVKYRAVVQPAVSTLFVNPGGPSASGKDFLIATGNEFSALFEGKVDFIGVDPRGVGDSTPKIDCVGFGQNTSFMADGFSVFGAKFLPNNSTVFQQRYFDATMRLNAKLCELNTGDFLKFTTTAHIANDLDFIRQALELEKLNYWGFNYGTVLGLTYANMFPERVGNIILDSVINPNEYFKSALEFVII